MKNQFAAEYSKSIEILIKYNTAKAANDEAGMAAARAAHMEQEARIDAMGTTFSRLFDRYVLLGRSHGVGTVEAVFDAACKPISETVQCLNRSS